MNQRTDARDGGGTSRSLWRWSMRGVASGLTACARIARSVSCVVLSPVLTGWSSKTGVYGDTARSWTAV